MHRIWLCGVVVLAACAAGTPASTPARLADDPAVVVASFNFSESAVVAEIYAQALESAGIPVRRELDLGPRELVQPALTQGLVDVVPEYMGSALRALYPELRLNTSDSAAVRAQLVGALAPSRIDLLDAAPAQDQNGFAMLRTRANELGVRAVSDLRHHPELVLGGPPECPIRDYCMVGLRQVYGVTFSQFVPLASAAQEHTALEQGVIDVAVMFTTDGHLAEPSLVLLDDDLRLQPVDNIVPVVSERVRTRYGDRLTTALNSVSAQLTSASVTFLNWRVEIDGKAVRDEASGWLARHQP